MYLVMVELRPPHRPLSLVTATATSLGGAIAARRPGAGGRACGRVSQAREPAQRRLGMLAVKSVPSRRKPACKLQQYAAHATVVAVTPPPGVRAAPHACIQAAVLGRY